jgi:ubiquinone/menaquinone biosynthesis C-methylase UbiE
MIQSVSSQTTATARAAAPAGRSPDRTHRQAMATFGATHYAALDQSRRRHSYFHRWLTRLVANQVLPGSSVLDIGCGPGAMLAALQPSRGVGIDINPVAIAEARRQHPELEFHELAAEDVATLAGGAAQDQRFDYVILSGVLPQLYDLHTVLEALRSVCHARTRLVITTFSRLWQPAIRCGEALGLKARVPDESWLPATEVRNILAQCDLEVVRQIHGLVLPIGIPLVSNLVNRWIAPLPGINHLGLSTVSIARLLPRPSPNAASEARPSVSIIVPARNEAGNLRPLLERIPTMTDPGGQGKQEVIFIEGNSSDDTWQVMQQLVADYQASGGPFHVSCCQQTGKGKGDAVRLGFGRAQGDILLILDADISVPPEELPRFVDLVARGKCEFANGSRLVYPMDKRAMRFLNMIANKGFGWMFTFLLGQHLRDTLCGTKVLRRADYERIAANRAYFGDFDPFGDFDLLFGAARLNLKIVDVPVHYKERVYGETNISRFRNGLMLLRMCAFAARKIKFV